MMGRLRFGNPVIREVQRKGAGGALSTPGEPELRTLSSPVRTAMAEFTGPFPAPIPGERPLAAQALPSLPRPLPRLAG